MSKKERSGKGAGGRKWEREEEVGSGEKGEEINNERGPFISIPNPLLTSLPFF